MRAEALFFALLLAGPGALFVGICLDAHGLLGGFLAMIGYTGLFFLMMAAVNRPSRDEQLIIDRAKAEARRERRANRQGVRRG